MWTLSSPKQRLDESMQHCMKVLASDRNMNALQWKLSVTLFEFSSSTDTPLQNSQVTSSQDKHYLIDDNYFEDDSSEEDENE